LKFLILPLGRQLEVLSHRVNANESLACHEVNKHYHFITSYSCEIRSAKLLHISSDLVVHFDLYVVCLSSVLNELDQNNSKHVVSNSLHLISPPTVSFILPRNAYDFPRDIVRVPITAVVTNSTLSKRQIYSGPIINNQNRLPY